MTIEEQKMWFDREIASLRDSILFWEVEVRAYKANLAELEFKKDCVDFNPIETEAFIDKKCDAAIVWL